MPRSPFAGFAPGMSQLHTSYAALRLVTQRNVFFVNRSFTVPRSPFACFAPGMSQLHTSYAALRLDE